MQLTRKAEYAIRAMVDLATHYDNQPVMSREVATRQDIPLKFLVQIIPDLKSAGLIHTVRGNGGGIYPTRKPDEINVKQVIEAIEGPIALNHCLVGDQGCARKPYCSIHKIWRLAQAQMVQVLESTTLAVLAVTKKLPIEDQDKPTSETKVSISTISAGY